MDDREGIRRAYFLEHRSIRTTSKELKHARDVIDKATESAEHGEYTLRQRRPAPALGSYLPHTDELLAQSARPPRKLQYTGHKIH